MASLNLDQLQTFCLVVRTGSFSAAASQLALSQPAVSLQVRQLETWFGVRLLERTAKGMKPTAAGITLLEKAVKLEAVIEVISDSVTSHGDILAGTVSIGAGATACIHLMPPILQTLRHVHPQLIVCVQTGNTREMVKAVEENRLDAGLVTLPVSGRQTEVLPVMQDEFVLILAENEPGLSSPVTPDAISALPLIVFEQGSGTRALIDNWFTAAELVVKPVMELGSIEAIKRMVAAGMGYSLVPRMAVQHQQSRVGLSLYPLNPPLTRELAVVLRRDKPVNRGLRALINALQGK